MLCWEKKAAMRFASRGMKICGYSYFYGLRWLLDAVGLLQSPAGQAFCLWEAAQGAGNLSSHFTFVLFHICQLPPPCRSHRKSCLDRPLVWPSMFVLIFLLLGLCHLELVLCLLQNFQIGKCGEEIKGTVGPCMFG